MSERQLVSPDELVAILNRELAKCPECNGVRVSYPPSQLREPDEEGCNWDRNPIILGGPPSRPVHCAAAAALLLEEVGKRYNLRP